MTGLRRLLWRDVLDRRAQFAAVGITVLLGVALFGASYDSYQNLSASYLQLYDDLAFADLTIRTTGNAGEVDAAVTGVAGVSATETRTVADVPIDVGSDRFLGRVVGQPVDREPGVDRVLVLEGTGLDPSKPDGVLVERHMAEQFGLHPGDTVALPDAGGGHELTILGVVASAEYVWPARSRQEVLTLPGEFGVLFVAEALAEAQPPQAAHQEVLVRLAPDAPDGAADAATAAALAAGAADVVPLSEQPSNAALQEDVSGFGELAIGFPLLFLTAAALATSILLGRLVASRRAQIGVLLASGFRRRAILRHYLAFGLAIGLAGAVPGAILGALIAAVMTRLYTGVLGIPVSVVEVRPLTVAIGLVIGPLAGAIAAYPPARAAARLSPAEAMHGPAPSGHGGRSLVERLVPPLRRLPVRWLTAIRGLGRNRRRTFSSIAGIALASILVFVSWGLVDTTTILLDRQFVEIQRNDATVYLAQPAAAGEAVAPIAAVAGVEAAEPSIERQVTLANGDRRYTTTLVGLEPGTTMHVFRAPGGDHVDLPADGGLLVGIALRDRLGLEPGDPVKVIVGSAPGDGSGSTSGSGSGGSSTAVVTGFVDEPFGTYAYRALPAVAADAGLDPTDPTIRTVLVRFDPEADRAVVTDRLEALPGVAGAIDARALYDAAQSLLGFFYAFVVAMLVLGGVMAFALIFNTMSANVAERRTELAALRTLGLRRATIGRLVTAENLLLTLIGLVPGLVAGYAIAAVFMASFSSDLFRFDLAVYPTTFLGTAVAIVVVALLSQGPALRAIGRIDLGRLVRERSI